MAIPLLALDDRKFTDLVDELRALIPPYGQRWTDYNVSDPGIMLIELFAWLTEALLYRINRVPDASRVRLLELLGAVFQPAAPAIFKLTIADGALAAPYTLPSGTVIRAKATPHSAELLFETMAAITLGVAMPVQSLLVRQSAAVTKQRLGMGTGAAHQIFELPQRYLLLPAVPFPQRPNVWVNDQLWFYRTSLSASEPDAQHFTIKPWLNALLFGDGTHGQIPCNGAKITVSYRFGSAPMDKVQKEVAGVSNGQAGQVFRLLKPLLPLDLQLFDDLMPTVRVNGEVWEYRTNYLEMAADALTYTVEPWRNALRFGDGVHGRKPAVGAPIELDCRYTSGDQGNVPNGTTFCFDRQATGHPHLRIEETFECISPGRQPTGPDEVDDQLYPLLHEQWRAITSTDIETLIRQNFGEIAQSYALPGFVLDAKTPTVNQPGQMGVMLAPQPTAQMCVDLAAMTEVLGVTLNGQRVVARDQAGVIHLWDAQSGKTLATLGLPLHGLAGCPDSEQIAVVSADQQLWLWPLNTAHPTSHYVHPAPVMAVALGYAPAIADQPTYVATACTDHLVRVWDVACMSDPLATFHHAAPVNALAFSLDGQFLVSGSNDGLATVWSIAKRQQVAVLSCPDQQAAIFAVAFSPDGQLVATAGLDRKVSLWLWQEKQVVAALPHASSVLALRFHPVLRQLVTACRDGTAQVWEIDSATRLGLFQHAGPVNALAIDATGQFLATASADHTVGLWDWHSLQKVALVEHQANVSAVVFTDPETLITGCDDGAVRLWALTDVYKPQQTKLFPDKLQAVTFSPDGQRLTALAGDRYAALWDTATGTPIANLAQSATVQQVVFSPDGQRLATIHTDHNVRVWDAALGDLLTLLPGDINMPPVIDVRFRPDNQQLVTIDACYTVRLWDLIHKPRLVWPHPVAVKQATFCTNGMHLRTVDSTGVVRRWDSRTGEPCTTTTNEAETIATDLLPVAQTDFVCFSSDGQQCAKVVGGTNLYVYDVASGALVISLPQPYAVLQVLFHPTMPQLVTVNSNDTVYLWSTQPAKALSTATQATALRDVCFNQSGTRLAIRLVNQQAQLWSTQKVAGAPWLILGDDVTALAFSPDGQRLATVHHAGAAATVVKVWSAQRGMVEQLLPCDTPVSDISFSPSGQRLLTIGDDGTTYTLNLWDLRGQNRMRPLCSTVQKEIKALLLNTSGRWLALVGERLLQIYDLEQGRPLSALYLDFTTPEVQADPWLLYYWEPQTNSYHYTSISSQTSHEPATNSLLRTQGNYILVTSSAPPGVASAASRTGSQHSVVDATTNPFTTHGTLPAVTARTIAVWNAEHVYAVDRLLQQRRLLTTQTQVAGLQYTNVALLIQVVRQTTAKSIARLEGDVTTALLRFFHPLTGGPDGKGWPPGRAVYRSEVYQVIEGVAGVDHVAALKFDPPGDTNCVVIPPYQGVNARIQVEILD